MSVEVVTLDDGELFVIVGDPGRGYDVRPVGIPVARFRRKYEARQALRSGELEAVLDELARVLDAESEP